MRAAQSPGWSLGLGRHGDVMATRDSGEIGHPWVLLAKRAGRTTRLFLYHPGDDVEAEGEVVGEISGSARHMGRELREVLSSLELDS